MSLQSEATFTKGGLYIEDFEYSGEKGFPYLRDCDSAFPRQLFLGFFTWVWVAQMRVEIFVQDFRRLLTEVTSLSSAQNRETHVI